MRYEYTVIPAPSKGVKAKGVKTPEARFALGLQDVMNEMGAQGWEYQRADTLPSTERSGLTGSATTWRHVLVFRRALNEPQPRARVQEVAAAPPPAEPAPSEPTPVPDPEPQPVVRDAAEHTGEPPIEADPDRPAGQAGATRMLKDNGVEETSDVAGVSTSLETLAKTRKSPFDSDP